MKFNAPLNRYFISEMQQRHKWCLVKTPNAFKGYTCFHLCPCPTSFMQILVKQLVQISCKHRINFGSMWWRDRRAEQTKTWTLRSHNPTTFYLHGRNKRNTTSGQSNLAIAALNPHPLPWGISTMYLGYSKASSLDRIVIWSATPLLYNGWNFPLQSP